MGGYEAATGGGLFGVGTILLGLTKVTEEQKDAIDGAISKLASVLKAYLEPLNMKLTDLKTAADVSAVLNFDGPETTSTEKVPVNRVDSSLRENRTYRRR